MNGITPSTATPRTTSPRTTSGARSLGAAPRQRLAAVVDITDRCGERVAELLTAVGLTPDHAARHPHELSGGQRQRVSVARALAAEPDVLLCDEITSALDADAADGIMELLRGLRTDRGLAVVLVSHDLPLVSAHADLLLTLNGTGRAPLTEHRTAPSPVPN